MVATATLFLFAILALDFAISLWNAYASGLTLTLLRGQPRQGFAKAAAIAGLALAFVGMCYVLIIVFAYGALVLGYLAVGDFLFLVAFDFLVFGAMIIGLGLVVTAQSIAVAYRQRRWGDIGVAIWNVFTEIWDISIYAEGFKDASRVVSSDRNKINLYAVVAAAVGVGFIITYVAYRHGVRKAEETLEAHPDQPPTGEPPYDSKPLGKAHPLRTVLIAGLVTVVVVVALIAVAPYIPRPPQVVVTEIDVYAPTNTCGLNSNPASYAGFTDSPGARDAFSLQIRNFNATGCVVNHAATNSSGFTVTNVGTPVFVAGLGNGTLNLTILLPGVAYSGVLNLIYT